MSIPSDSPAIQALRARAQAAPGDAASQMQLGIALHEAGELEQALAAFQAALAAAPGSVNAASACATLLDQLKRPQAAYQVLASVKEQLLSSANGATNLAIAAENCGLADEARQAYEHALRLDPDHVGALNNTALLAARDRDWAIAVPRSRRCLELQPRDPMLWLNLGDMLIGAREFAAAAGHLARGVQLFPGAGPLAVRHAVALAFMGEVEEAQARFDAMGAAGEQLLREFLKAGEDAGAPGPKGSITLPRAWELFAHQAFVGLNECNWRDHDRFVEVLREMLAAAERDGIDRDWRDMQFYALMLPLTEDEQTTLRKISGKAIATGFPAPPMPPRRAAQAAGERIRIGLSIQSLTDTRYVCGLLRQLSHHDKSRFSFHIYSPTPQPRERLSAILRPHVENVVEIAHMTDREAAQRIRLDKLDLWVDTAFYTPWCRPELPALRVAPVQMRSQTWQRIHPLLPCEYSIGDVFTHPDLHETQRYGAVARLPFTCWLGTNDETPDPAPVTREETGLPEGAVVFCCFAPAVTIDPATFSAWMRAMKRVPDSVLWLPGFTPATRRHLTAAADAAGVAPARLIFAQKPQRQEALARIPLADLFLDTLRFNANHGLADALRLGVPAVTCAGHNMASRLGASVVSAAGLPGCVKHSEDEYVEAIVALGNDRPALAALRASLAAARETAPYFDIAGRVKEWESAWATMVERSRSGLAPAAFDVAPAA